MAVPAGPTEQRYVGNGVSTIFTVPFLVIQASDLAVYVDGVKLGSGYSQAGVGNPTSTVVFTAAPVLNAQILFALEVPFERLNDYQENGDFLSTTVNRDFDRLWQALKQLLRYSDRSLRLGQFDVDGQGWYRAKGNGIRDLRDPVEDQDAATKNWAQQYIAGILQTGQGPINNAENTVYVDGDGVATSVQRGVAKQFSSVQKLRQMAGSRDGEQCLLLGWYASTPGIGGGKLYWDSSSEEVDDGGTIFAVVGVPVGRWKRVYNDTLDLYHFGGTYQGDCVAAMDAALASPVDIIKVPDNVILGYHVFDAPKKKTIVGGVGISFGTGPCGIWPRNCRDITVRDFVDVVLAPYPLQGGDIATGQQFLGLGSGAVIGDITVTRCSGSGGKIGIGVGFENGRTLTGTATITYNNFKGQNGTDGGEGYGIHYGNENDTGDAYIAMNKVAEDGRHGIYLARNRGGGKIILVGNRVTDHRINSPTQGAQTRGAFQINRCKNVHGYANSVIGFHDSAIMIFEETEAAISPVDAQDVCLRDTTLINPRNGTAGVIIGSGTAIPGRLTQNITIDTLRFKSDGTNSTAIQYGRGKNIEIRNIFLEYYNISSGVIRPLVYLGNTLADSGDVNTRHVRLYARGCSGASFDVFRLTGSVLSLEIPMTFDDLRIDSDATSNRTFGPSGAVTQKSIQVRDADLSGWTGSSWPSSRPNPSQPWNGQFITAGIATPVGNILPNFIGQDCYLQSNGTFWKAFGLTNANWKQTA